MKQAKTIIAQSGIGFGTSGARGLITDFTDEVCAAFTCSFLEGMKAEFSFNHVAVGMDNRPSSPKMAAAVCSAIKQAGFESVFYGVLPTPALAYKAMQDEQPCIMITGSHIPFDRNGIKFYRPDGEITKADEAAILACDVVVHLTMASLPTVAGAALEAYEQRYVSFFGESALSGLKVGVYEHSSAGRDIYAGLFERLGAEVVSLERSDAFVPIDTEAVSAEDSQKAKTWSAEYHFDVLFSTDGDGDRPLIGDENGVWLRGDVVGLLTAKLLGIEALAVPVNCNTAIELSGLFKVVQRTRVGSPFVIEAFADLDTNFASVAGFEANGGFLLGSAFLNEQGVALNPLPTRDALLPAMVLFSQVALGKQLSSLVSSLPARFTASDRLQGIPSATSWQLVAEGLTNSSSLLTKLGLNLRKAVEVDITDGLRLILDDGCILHLRPSGNAPELRCYTEADKASIAEALVRDALTALKTS